jgi:hypothetical protein
MADSEPGAPMETAILSHSYRPVNNHFFPGY